MPNWCENRLLVEGKTQALEQFVKSNQGQYASYANNPLPVESDLEQSITHPLSFNAQVPVPKTVLNQGFHKAGYDWQIENWGTKWEAHEVRMTTSANQVNYDFLTAWSPPLLWLYKVSGLFPKVKLTLKFEEPGMGYEGRLIMKNGHEIENYYREL